MGGGFSTGGLITGIDSNSIISQLIQLERQPVNRIRAQIKTFETQQKSIKELRTQLLSLRNLFKDFQLGLRFDSFSTPSSNESIVTASALGSNPTLGSFQVDVQQLAGATIATGSSRLGSPINPGATLATSGIGQTISTGTFSINGVQFNVDPATQSLNTILNAINASSAGVTASFDAVNDRVVITNTAAADTSIVNFGATGDTSDFLSVIALEQAVQSTGASGSTTVTSSRNLGTVNSGKTLNTVTFAGGAVTAGGFRVNGVSITVDPTVDSLGDVLARINASDAGVTATFDSTTDGIRIVSDTLGSRTIAFAPGTSNFLNVANLAAAVQTAGQDAQFTIDGGAVQSSNTNDVSTAIGGVLLNFTGIGSSTVTVQPDADAITTTVQEFVDAFNGSITAIADVTAEGGDLENDNSIRSIASFLRANIFSQVTGIAGGIESLLDIGISTGDAFDPSANFQLQVDAAALRTAITDNRAGVESLFVNSGKTGVIDVLFDFIDSTTGSTGFLNERARAGGSLDARITAQNSRIDTLERTIALREARLRRQFANLETFSNTLQTQAGSLSALSQRFGSF